jgi:putative (di)nucleoside polyphosphate hydrolase
MNFNKQLPLRSGVGIILLNRENRILVGKRIDNPKYFWQMPQGGVNKNENFFQAAKRELEEETAVKSIKLIKEINEFLIYELPQNLLGKVFGGRYRGQKQKWFIMKFIGEDKEINVNTENPEFLDWKWIKISELSSVAVDFKANLYKRLEKELNFLK